VIAGGEKYQATLLGTKHEPEVKPCTALEIVSSKASNAEAGMEMRLAKCVADCIDHSRNSAPLRFWKSPNVSPKRC